MRQSTFIGSRKLDDNVIEILENECTIWAGLCHPNIVDFYGMSWTSSDIWLLCEFMPDGSLYHINELKRLAHAPPPAEAEVLESLQQVAAGMAYLHGLEPPVLHRDLKSPNVLLAGKRLAIADFGLARYQKLDSVRHSLSHHDLLLLCHSLSTGGLVLSCLLACPSLASRLTRPRRR